MNSGNRSRRMLKEIISKIKMIISKILLTIQMISIWKTKSTENIVSSDFFLLQKALNNPLVSTIHEYKLI